jgi:hypothetical protein
MGKKMKINNKKHNTIEFFVNMRKYGRASQSESPNEKCKDCSALFTFKGKTRCYAYETLSFKEKIEFNPRRDYNCNLFDDTGEVDRIKNLYKKSLLKGNNPENDPEYQKELKEENDYYKAVLPSFSIFTNCGSDNLKECDEPRSRAYCTDWEDEPENCGFCAEDGCPMNRG